MLDPGLNSLVLFAGLPFTTILLTPNACPSNDSEAKTLAWLAPFISILTTFEPRSSASILLAPSPLIARVSAEPLMSSLLAPCTSNSNFCAEFTFISALLAPRRLIFNFFSEKVSVNSIFEAPRASILLSESTPILIFID